MAVSCPWSYRRLRKNWRLQFHGLQQLEMPYERHYSDCFLDGFHNYFPEILYGPPEQFGTASPLVSYIQHQVHRNFDLASAARRTYTSQFQTPPRVQTRTEPPPLQRADSYNDDRARVITAFASLLTGTGFDMPIVMPLHPAQNMMESVVVRPSAQQIENGTQIEIIDAESEICTICQDRMEPGSDARCIRACDHRFHIECIDTWFMRSVNCPTCRHDVRESTD